VGGARARAAEGAPPWRSRGQLVLSLLRGTGALALDALRAAADSGAAAALELDGEYGPANIIVARLESGRADADELFFLTNVSAGGAAEQLARCTVARIEGGAHALSNSAVLDDTTWPKVSWLRGLVDESVSDSPGSVGGGADGSLLAASALIRRLVPALASEEPVPESAVAAAGPLSAAADLSWSPLPPSMEAVLQRHIRVPRLGAPFHYGSRSLSVVVRVPGSADVFFAYASFDDDLGGDAKPVDGDSATVLPAAELVVDGLRVVVWRL
jgi:hypothetical protein